MGRVLVAAAPADSEAVIEGNLEAPAGTINYAWISIAVVPVYNIAAEQIFVELFPFVLKRDKRCFRFGHIAPWIAVYLV